MRVASTGDTPLLLAAKTAQSSSAQALIEAGADIKVRDDAGNSVLHYAAADRHDRHLRTADRSRHRRRRSGAGGATPLQLAVQAGRQETAKYLVRRGASLEQKNDAAMSALDMVARSGDPRFKNDLEAAAKMRDN